MVCFSFAARNEWQLVKPIGKSPTRRRRQSCLVYCDKVFLFGGTSPYCGPQPFIPDVDDMHAEGLDAKLMDHNDLHVLDFKPSLRTLCLMSVIQNHLSEGWLPVDLKWNVKHGTYLPLTKSGMATTRS
ncbi:hypothetical protein C0J52_21540 [Blattella germanica]|nr:hypothetical protein C0J52_21540 [Blattella germanica]